MRGIRSDKAFLLCMVLGAILGVAGFYSLLAHEDGPNFMGFTLISSYFFFYGGSITLIPSEQDESVSEEPRNERSSFLMHAVMQVFAVGLLLLWAVPQPAAIWSISWVFVCIIYTVYAVRNLTAYWRTRRGIRLRIISYEETTREETLARDLASYLSSLEDGKDPQ